MQNEKSAISLSCLPVFSHNITCAQVGNKCGLTSALIGQKSESELSPNLCEDVSVFIPNLGIILPVYNRRYKLASSVNLYRFTIFANPLVGATSPIPFEHHLSMMAARSFWAFPRVQLLANLSRSNMIKNNFCATCAEVKTFSGTPRHTCFFYNYPVE